MSKLPRWLALGATAIILLWLWAWTPWAKYRYHGDGTFSDSGFFSYPRYEIRFASISLSKVGEYRYHFRGIPNEEMTLLLVTDRNVHYESKEWDTLIALPATIQAVLTDGHGREACRAEGRPEDSNKDGVWVLTTGFRTAYWHLRCTHVQLHPSEGYELVIGIKIRDPHVDVTVTLVLEGGGLELP